ncbi:DR2241 family protein [Natrarchaeobaculum aegyptiacum]|uniref:Uncharacterized protein n=1 Tax=Natrarchaeobaculum aegyptiacum TaxID=745377 RepID=A0A2Z2I2J2_9EURY|nr:DR2241 family protein [Natrarchaeobaculum aegyptiacum]ARS91108.1 hypothetical protein B1756_16135 [Natrarchaeobaculum aegyptiacum]
MTDSSRLADALPEALERADGELAFDGLRFARTGDRDEKSDAYVLEVPSADPLVLDVDSLADALEADAVRPYVTNWAYWHRVGGPGTYRRAFLRWCERAPIHDVLERVATGDPLTVPDRYEALADGIDRTWGELSITSRLPEPSAWDGERVYDLWHVEDAGADVADLEVYDDPTAARDIATYDDDGRYRPLKTAPSLPAGWAFTGLSGSELVETVERFYPATVANWHQELRGDLDVDHWLETAARQTGIFDVVDELPREAVDWMVEACCVDSQCLRRREWHYTDDDELSVDGGDQPFPCREPCSLVIAAARQWAILESETERTYELELTPSEVNQLSALIDAVADDRLDEIREADVGDGANRYRARYLRAKRFGGNGLEPSEK